MPKDVYNSHYEKLPNGEVRCIDSEIPFEIPSNWAWCRIKNLFFTTSGGTPIKGHPEYYINGTIPWIKSGELKSKYLYVAEEKITEEALKNSSAKFFPVDTVAVAMYGATIGKTSIFKAKMTTNQAICGIFPNGYIIPEYLYYFIQAKTIDYLSIAFGSGQPNISQEKIKETLMPIPPITEQKKIVERLDLLIEQVKQYNKFQVELDQLNTDVYSLLKKSILQEAIQGRLVEQCETDEPATKLLERIRVEKQKLVKEGKLKAKDITDSIIYKGDDNKYYEKCGNAIACIDSEVPFKIPDNWAWCRLSQLAVLITGTSYNKSDVCKDGIRILRGGNIQETKLLTYDNDVFLPYSYADENKQIRVNDIIIVGSTGSKEVIGKPAFITVQCADTQIGAFLRIVRPYFAYYASYIQILFSSKYYRQHIQTKVKGTNINNIKAEYIANLLVPIPPLTEIERILAKKEELFNKL